MMFILKLYIEEWHFDFGTEHLCNEKICRTREEATRLGVEFMAAGRQDVRNYPGAPAERTITPLKYEIIEIL